MQKQSFSFNEFNFSSQLIKDLVEGKTEIKPFVQDFFSEEQMANQIKRKLFTDNQRTILVDSLQQQNKNIHLSELSLHNIELLKQENTFTITTGHQLNLMTGPLYSIYKILQVIIWREKLKKSQPNYHFVPLFWMATEDHDFEEINHIHLFNKKIAWEKENQENYIAGAITTDDNFEKQFTQPILELFNDDEVKNKVENYLAYYKNNNLATATRLLLNDLFGEYGLIILDGNDKALKQQFISVAGQELKHQVTHTTVGITNKKLNNLGYHNQVFLRESNLFYIENNRIRHRIVKTNTAFEINGQAKTESELIEELNEFPERFSPNALLRPVYQETVLPNLCYFGGGGEIAYWLQLKDLFDVLNLTFPLLRVRDSYVLLNKKQLNQLDDLGLSVLDLKQNYDDLIKLYINTHTTKELTLEQEKEALNQIKTAIINKTNSKDVGLSRFIESEVVKMNHQLEKIEKKLLQNEKKNQEQTLKQIKRLRDKIYPSNGFQERHENVLQYIHLSNFINDLKMKLEATITENISIKIFEV
jgi:bacillithiol biosynthesis cysteine-adding enzyme BshC